MTNNIETKVNNKNNGENKMSSTISFNDIKTPTSVEEFRENLTKYYVSIEGKVYIQPLGYVDVDKLDSMDDVKKMVEEKGREIYSIQLTPSVIQTTKWKDWVRNLTKREEFWKTTNRGMDWVCVNWWLNDNNNIIFEFDKDNPNSFENFTKLNSKYQKDIYWKNFFGEDCWDDNDNFRDYYIKTLGSYSGWCKDGDDDYGKDGGGSYDFMVEKYGDDEISNLNL